MLAQASDGEGTSLGSDLIAQAVADHRAQRHEAGVGDRVVRSGALGPAGHDLGVVEHTQMLVHIGLAGAEALDELANVQLTVVEQCADDGEAGGIAQHAEAFGDVFEQVWWQSVGHIEHYITM